MGQSHEKFITNSFNLAMVLGREPTTDVITHSIGMRRMYPDGTSSPIDAVLDYDPRNPHAVTAILSNTTESPADKDDFIVHEFGRELLAGGLFSPTGKGNVRIRPGIDSATRTVSYIELCTPSETSLYQADSGQLSAFVDRMYEEVPAGEESEHIDVEAAIAAILTSRRQD